MTKIKSIFVGDVLHFIYESSKLLPLPFENPYRWAQRNHGVSRPNYYAGIFQLQKSGVLKVTRQKNKKFIELTQKGQLKVLLNKAQIRPTLKWDGKWRLIIYDIPEASKPQRNIFRRLLKRNGFYKLQASVFISPHPLNRSAVEYLKLAGLIRYIRIIRADEIDDNRELLKKFNLFNNKN